MSVKVKTKFRAKRVQGKPWSELAGNIPLTPDVLRDLGKILIRHIVSEAKKDLGRRSLPRSERFLKSFGFRIVGKKTIEIFSTWPNIEGLLEGRDPFPMYWLTRERGIAKVPIWRSDGTVVIRSTPLKVADAWIHPGYARHTFVSRGIKKGRIAAAKKVGEGLIRRLMEGDPLR